MCRYDVDKFTCGHMDHDRVDFCTGLAYGTDGSLYCRNLVNTPRRGWPVRQTTNYDRKCQSCLRLEAERRDHEETRALFTELIDELTNFESDILDIGQKYFNTSWSVFQAEGMPDEVSEASRNLYNMFANPDDSVPVNFYAWWEHVQTLARLGLDQLAESVGAQNPRERREWIRTHTHAEACWLVDDIRAHITRLGEQLELLREQYYLGWVPGTRTMNRAERADHRACIIRWIRSFPEGRRAIDGGGDVDRIIAEYIDLETVVDNWWDTDP